MRGPIYPDRTHDRYGPVPRQSLDDSALRWTLSVADVDEAVSGGVGRAAIEIAGPTKEAP